MELYLEHCSKMVDYLDWYWGLLKDWLMEQQRECLKVLSKENLMEQGTQRDCSKGGHLVMW